LTFFRGEVNLGFAAIVATEGNPEHNLTTVNVGNTG
jgi:hypothetical protein